MGTITVILSNSIINFKDFLIQLQCHTKKMSWSKHANTAAIAKQSLIQSTIFFPSLVPLNQVPV